MNPPIWSSSSNCMYLDINGIRSFEFTPYVFARCTLKRSRICAILFKNDSWHLGIIVDKLSPLNKMGILLETQNDVILDQVLDTFIIFILGSVLLFFFHTMVNRPRTFLVSFASYITVLIIALMLYINQMCQDAKQDNKNKFAKTAINFMSIYTICLNGLLVFVVSQELI